ncbi:MAG: DUF2066 domain-containing protein [Alphaproteobacteria bacterium]
MLGILGPLAPAHAQQAALNDVFLVRDVQLDETAISASAARSIALEKGQIEAARHLFARLTRDLHAASVEVVDAQTIRALVSSLQIGDEKTSDVRYLAKLTVAFNPDAVRRFLRFADVPFAELKSRPVLVIPVLQQAGQYVLWEDPNPWREAWRNHPDSFGLVPVVSPVGDLSDYAGLSAEQAVDADVGALNEAAARYGAGSAVVAIASIVESFDGSPTVEITASRVGRLDEIPLVLAVTGLVDETPEALFERATGVVITALDDDWKRTNAVTFGAAAILHAAVPVRDLGNWVDIRSRLEVVPSISAVRLLALTGSSAEIEVDYFGDEERLRRALDRFDLVLEATRFVPSNGSLNPNVAGPMVPSHVIRLPAG